MSEVGRALAEAAAGHARAVETETAVARLAERAEREGALDVAYAEVDSPVGPLLVAATRRGLVRVGFLPAQDGDETLEEIARRISPRILEAPARFDSVRRQLEEYFEGRRRRFELRLDWRLARGDFGRRVLRATARIPYGRTRTYTEVAETAGSPRAYRAAGNALGANPIPIVVPCHRVLHSGGGLGGYGGGLDVKQHLLRLEGALDR